MKFIGDHYQAVVRMLTFLGAFSLSANVRGAEMSEGENPAITQGRHTVDALRNVLTRVMLAQQAARIEKDVVKLNCINDKVVTIKGLVKVSEQSLIGLTEALIKGDDAAAAHESEKLGIAAERSNTLSVESEGCIGEVAAYTGGTRVDVTYRDSNVTTALAARGGETHYGAPILYATARPPAASPFQ